MDKEINIVLADDDEIFKSIITKFINVKAWGIIQVLFTVGNGRELLDTLRATTSKLPDIILLDLKMPVLDGVQTAKILRDRYPEIKIIAFTELDFEWNIVEMNKVGVKSFIGKSQVLL